MNENQDRIIATYKDADFNHRLHIYLQYPELRSKFSKIDLEGFKAASVKSVKFRPNSLAAHLNEFIGSIAGSVKRLVGVGPA